MEMASMIAAWWTPVAWVYLVAALISAGVLVYDISVRGHRQRVRLMELVWPVSALFLGPAALWLYARWGRPTGNFPQQGVVSHTIVGLLPGAAASTVAHLIGVPVVFGAGWTIAGLALWAVALFIAILATALLFGFEYAALAGTRESRPTAARSAAVFLASLITVLAFDVGMVGWMLYLHANNLMTPITDVVFTFQMQIGMILGMLTAYPLTLWLTTRQVTADTTNFRRSPGMNPAAGTTHR